MTCYLFQSIYVFGTIHEKYEEAGVELDIIDSECPD
jgi:hypothetical protein